MTGECCDRPRCDESGWSSHNPGGQTSGELHWGPPLCTVDSLTAVCVCVCVCVCVHAVGTVDAPKIRNASEAQVNKPPENGA